MFLIDTNCFIYHNKGIQKHFIEWYRSIPDNQVFLSCFVYSELREGYLINGNTKLLELTEKMKEHYNFLDFSAKDAFIWSNTRVESRKKGIQLAKTDLYIASQAINNNLTLVTFNQKDFEKIPRLRAKFFNFEG